MSNDQTCLLSNHSCLVEHHSVHVLVLCLRVVSSSSTHYIDLPELLTIQMGYSAFEFDNHAVAPTLIMRSEREPMEVTV